MDASRLRQMQRHPRQASSDAVLLSLLSIFYGAFRSPQILGNDDDGGRRMAVAAPGATVRVEMVGVAAECALVSGGKEARRSDEAFGENTPSHARAAQVGSASSISEKQPDSRELFSRFPQRNPWTEVRFTRESDCCQPQPGWCLQPED
ncbi:hypothetical protein BIW11_09826 [Tropilaelaps mercedesae]|uniref:Uncharacterized protein n=1 Tax=Tropilaelaps mercedesae TaxID=418985 RepID=A0A1V9XIB3_9ACAR|nr:hypothetical protein BIW11_09826 [Tropilaelaps mercedesae]